jgi:hypothetical protein
MDEIQAGETQRMAQDRQQTAVFTKNDESGTALRRQDSTADCSVRRAS